MPADPLFVLAVLAAIIGVSELLVRRTFLRHLGTALLVIVVTAVAANVGVLPAYSSDIPLYTGIFDYVANYAIFLLLLGVRLRELKRAGTAMIAMFLVGSVGTFVGVVAGIQLVGGREAFGDLYYALGGMFVGTYTGGSVNFNALAIEYGVNEDAPVLYAAANAVDSLMTTVWMAITLLVPRFLFRRSGGRVERAEGPITGEVDDTERVHPVDLAWLVALASAALWASGALSSWLAGVVGRSVPEILVLTTLALALGQLPIVARLAGARTLGMFAVYLFLAVIGALCDVSAVQSVGALAWTLFLFVAIALVIHGTIVFGLARVWRVDPELAAVASQANVGGGTSALALARSLGRADLVLPAILVGALGTALGTYLGLTAASLLG